MTDTTEPKKSSIFHKTVKFFDITKSKMLSSLLAGFAFSFFIFLYSTISVYFSNCEELPFSLMDFLPFYLIGFFAAFVFIFLVLLLTKKFLHRLAFSLTAGATLCAYVQSFITTLTFKGLPGDGLASSPSKLTILINLAVWGLALAGFVFFAFLRKKAEFVRTVLSIALIAVTVMQMFTLAPSAITYMSKNAASDKTTYILTTENQLELSADENIVVLVLDSFDRDFFLEYMESNPDAMEDFDGFTYYDDNIAYYPRTYPATASMLSGTVNDFSLSRKQYLENAYGDSVFLSDLVENDYTVNLYLPDYYGYDNADVLLDYADNTSEANGFKVTQKATLIKRMFYLSSYFWNPYG